MSGLIANLTKNSNKFDRGENPEWVASSKHWLDRQLCDWLGVCGASHLNSKAWIWDRFEDDVPPLLPDYSNWWKSGSEDPKTWSREERELREIPQYVFDHAPYVHLFSGEQFWPCDLAEHLVHTSPHVNYTKVLDLAGERNLTNLHELNDYQNSHYGKHMYLQSDDNVEERPEWLGGAKNIPKTPEAQHDENEGRLRPDHDFEGSSLESEKQHTVTESPKAQGVPQTESSGWTWPTPLMPSTNGRCGGNSGFTCTGSMFGQCCSIYGWCGGGDSYCGDPCNALAGECNDPWEPHPKPRPELRRRSLDLHGAKNKPLPVGKSNAPVILVVVPKGNGVVDAFWFFFYSFNLGQKVLNVRFGNHVGDWEHTMIRFKHGKPQEVFLSEHDFGDAYAWHALEKYVPSTDGSDTMIGTWSNETAAKRAKRPVVYSAVGSHAMYATPGLHPYILPWGLLHDQTDRGPLWDPSLNAPSYTYDHKSKTVRASTRNPNVPISWFNYAGHWGDKYYPLSDPRQYRIAGQYHYVNGPTGPRFKNLGRKKVCQAPGKKCNIRHWANKDRPKRLLPEEDVEEGGLPGGNMTDDASA